MSGTFTTDTYILTQLRSMTDCGTATYTINGIRCELAFDHEPTENEIAGKITEMTTATVEIQSIPFEGMN